MTRFPVLMYHRVVSPECPVPHGDVEESRYGVDLDEFRWQMERIRGSGRRGVSIRMIHDKLEADGEVPGGWVGLTFDDGNLSDYLHAFPVLADLGFRATFFVGVGRIGAHGGVEPAMLAEMAAAGMDIGSHGVSHRFLTELTAAEEEDELRQSRTTLEEASGGEILFYAPPGGRIGRRGVAAAERIGYRAVCTSRFGFNPRRGQRFSYRRIPVMSATRRGRFGAFVDAAVPRLLPVYARNGILGLARRVLGESRYRRVRALRVGE